MPNGRVDRVSFPKHLAGHGWRQKTGIDGLLVCYSYEIFNVLFLLSLLIIVRKLLGKLHESEIVPLINGFYV